MLDYDTKQGVRKGLEKGQFREAVLKRIAPGERKYYLQATIWRDKKQVCFLSTHLYTSVVQG